MRRLEPADAEALVVLRQAALQNEPLAFGAVPGDERGSLSFVKAALADRDEQAVFAHGAAVSLTGMVGVIRYSGLKDRHKARIWGMYVAPAVRGQGIGRSLLDLAIAHARGWAEVEQLKLSVTEVAPVAKRLYESAGFRSWGIEPRALQWQGRFVDEHHLVLDLRSGV